MASETSSKKLVSELEKAVKEAKSLLKVLGDTEKVTKELAKEMRDAFKSVDKSSSKGLAEFNQLLKDTNKLLKDTDTIQNQKLKTQKAEAANRAKLNSLRKGEQDALIKTKLAIQEETKAKKDSIKASKSLTPLYDKQKKKLNELQKELIEVSIAEGRSSKKAKELGKAVRKLNGTITKAEELAGRFQRNVGKYPQVFNKAIFAIAGGALSVQALGRAFGAAVDIAKEFEQSNANLASVLGKSRSQIGALTEDAKRLGAATSFSASEVSGLQTEFAKLGFNEGEIVSATEATLNLAAATGAELSEAAAIAGATLGGFGLSADSTQRVTDVMAKSFSTSALDIEKFRESMKSAAPAAKAVGIDVEETTALLGTLSNAGISGSKAGNSLKNTFINLNAAGLTMNQGFEQVNGSSNKLATAVELVGKESAAAFLVLADGVDSTEKLEKGLRSAGGAAAKMANEQLDTLEGSLKILNSAWEGFVLGLLSGDGAFSKASRGVVEFATNLLGVATSSSEVSDALIQEKTDLNLLVGAVTNANNTQESRIRLLKELNERYPEYLANVELDKVTNEELLQILKDVNEELTNKILIQINKEEIDDAQEKLVELIRTEQALIKSIAKREKAQKGVKDEEGNVIKAPLKGGQKRSNDSQIRQEILQLEKNRAAQQGLFDTINDLSQKGAELTEVTEEETKAVNSNTDATTKNNTAKKEKEKIVGLIAVQTKKISDLEEQRNKALTEGEIKRLTGVIDLENKKLDSLKAITTETERNEAAEKGLQELKLKQAIENSESIEDRVDEEIALEEFRTDELLKQANLTEDEKQLILAESLVAQRKIIEKGYDDINARDAEQSKKQVKADEDAEKARLEARQKLIEDGIAVIDDVLSRAREKQNRELDAEIDALDSRIDTVRDAINNGNSEASQSLAELEKQKIEAEKKKEELRKKEIRDQKIIAGLQLLSANSTEPNAVGKTLGDVSLLLAGLSSIQGFIDGTENVADSMQGHKVHNGTDGYIAKFDGREGILNPEQNAKRGSLSNDELVNLGAMHNAGTLNGGTTVLAQNNKELVKEVSKVIKAIENQPVPSNRYDDKAKFHEQVLDSKNKREIIKVRANNIYK